MHARNLPVLLLLAIIALPKPAAAVSAEAFLAGPDSTAPDSPDAAAFHAYLQGAMEAMVLYTVALGSAGHAGMICVPSGQGYDLDALRLMVSAALDARPEDAGNPLPQIVIALFAESHPCR